MELDNVYSPDSDHCHSHAHRPCPLLSAHMHNWPGRDRQHYKPIPMQKAADARCAQGMCSRELKFNYSDTMKLMLWFSQGIQKGSQLPHYI